MKRHITKNIRSKSNRKNSRNSRNHKKRKSNSKTRRSHSKGKKRMAYKSKSKSKSKSKRQSKNKKHHKQLGGGCSLGYAMVKGMQIPAINNVDGGIEFKNTYAKLNNGGNCNLGNNVNHPTLNTY